ncbi:MAG: DUF1801 domain-containing protein [Pseudomonadales bacterium]|nr:DUF1801 domain-containing protein [Pseudomonadales bacterium]
MASFSTVDDYLDSLDSERQAAVSRLRDTIRNNLPAGFEESMSGSMPSYVVPLDLYPAGYHVGKNTPLPFVSFASQKGHIALYHFGMYVDQELMAWFEAEYAKRVEHKLDMGKSCVRFKKPEQIPFELIGELMQQRTVEDWIACYDGMRPK